MSAIAFTPELLFVHDATTVVNRHRTGTLDIKTNDGKWIADVKPYGDTFPDYEEAKAYAKLFAAAPDLLECLREWCADYEQYQRGEGQGESRTSEIYRKAIVIMNKTV